MNFNPLCGAVLAVCAATTAQAQTSNVTLFGLIDLNVSNYSSGSKAHAGNLTLMQDGTTNGLNGSRWGIRTTEDLGGGLKAGVWMEAGLNADNGNLAQGGRAFGRQIFVWMSSPTAGELRLGRQYVLEDGVMGLSNPFGNALVLNQGTAVTNMGKSLPFWLNAPRADNVIQYKTPNFNGFTAAAQVAPGEGTADRFHGLMAGYAMGPLNAALSYEWSKPRSGGGSSNQSFTVGANYNFGSFKLLGGIQRNDKLTTTSGNGAAAGIGLAVTGPASFTANQINGYTIGVEIPQGNLLWGANYSAVKYESAAGAGATLGKLGLGVRYGFSKNTFLYSGVSLATGDLKEYISQKRVVQAGIRVAF
jgi:GBP family porin